MGQARGNNRLNNRLPSAADIQAQKVTQGNPSLEAQLRLMNHNLKLGRAISQFSDDIKFLGSLGTPGFEDTNKLYSSYSGAIDLVTALSDAIVYQQKAQLQMSPS